jgi:hypothetical protein
VTIIEREPNVSAPASFRSRIRPGATATGAALASVAVSLPEQVVGNADIAARFGVEASWIEGAPEFASGGSPAPRTASIGTPRSHRASR